MLNIESDCLNAFDQGDVTALEALAQQIADALLMQRQYRVFTQLKAGVAEQVSNERLLGDSKAMRHLRSLVRSLANSDMGPQHPRADRQGIGAKRR